MAGNDEVRPTVADDKRSAAIEKAYWIYCSPHEWPTVDDIPLLCHALLEECKRSTSAAEVIAAAEKALEVWKEDSATGVGTDASCPCLECKTYRQLGALIADWKAGRG